MEGDGDCDGDDNEDVEELRLDFKEKFVLNAVHGFARDAKQIQFGKGCGDIVSAIDDLITITSRAQTDSIEAITVLEKDCSREDTRFPNYWVLESVSSCTNTSVPHWFRGGTKLEHTNGSSHC